MSQDQRRLSVAVATARDRPVSVSSGTTCATVPLIATATRKNVPAINQNRAVRAASPTSRPGSAAAVTGTRRSPSPGRGSRTHIATAGNAIASVRRPSAR